MSVLNWMLEGKTLFTHHATDTVWSKSVALITQRVQTGNTKCPGILEVNMDWLEGKSFLAGAGSLGDGATAVAYPRTWAKCK